MIHGLAQFFCAAARAQVHPMNGQPLQESCLRKALNVTRIGGAFQPMREQEIAAGWPVGMMFENNDSGGSVNAVFDPLGRKPNRIDFARPIVAQNGQRVRIADNRLKLWDQTKL